MNNKNLAEVPKIFTELGKIMGDDLVNFKRDEFIDRDLTMRIKQLTVTDKNQWHTLWQGYQDFYQTDLPQEVTDSTWQKITADNSPIYGFGAWQGDELIAIAHITLHEHTWTTKPCCYLIDLFVAPNSRNQGIARAMIEHLYQFAKERDCDRVYWLTKEDNTTARALYDKLANKTDFVQYRHNI